MSSTSHITTTVSINTTIFTESSRLLLITQTLKKELDVTVNEGLILGHLHGEKWVAFMSVNCANDLSVAWPEGATQSTPSCLT